MISPLAFLVLSAVAAGVVWASVLLVRWGPLTAHRRAAIVYALAVAQPLLILLLSARTATPGGAVSEVPHSISLVGRALNLAMIGVAVTVVLAPGARIGQRGQLVVAGAWAMALSLYVANAFSPDPGSTRYEFYFAVALTAVALGVDGHLSLTRWARWTLRLIVVASLGSAVVAPTWAFIGEGAAGYDRTILGIPRLVGFSPHPNALAAIAVASLIIEVGCRDGNKRPRVIFGAAAAICIGLAQSNTGYIAAVVAVLAVATIRRPAYRRLLLTGAVVLLAVYIVRPQAVVPQRFGTSEYVASISGRTTIWSLSLDEWRKHPLTGYGPNMFSTAYLSAHFPPNLQATNGHDQLVETLADSGILGAASLALLISGVALCAWRARRVDGGLSIGLVVALATFGLTETPLRVVGVGIVPALVTLGVAIAGSRARDELVGLAADEAPIRSDRVLGGTLLPDSFAQLDLRSW